MIERSVLVAIGGNAILRAEDRGTAEEQMKNIGVVSDCLVELVRSGHPIALVHGNGPQVGMNLRRHEISEQDLPSYPLDLLTAESQGVLGCLIERDLRSRLAAAKIDREVSVLLTQVLVDSADPAFQNPTKPIGQFFSRAEIEALSRQDGFSFVEDSGRGFRRVVASPRPLDIIEKAAIRQLLDAGHIVVAAGGGGIPVLRREDGRLEGVEAVIDKDFASSLLGAVCGLESLILLTGVERVALRYGQKDQQFLEQMTTAQARDYLAAGFFPPGSMGPKVEAAVDFIERGGKTAIITSIGKMAEALAGTAGTRIVA